MSEALSGDAGLADETVSTGSGVVLSRAAVAAVAAEAAVGAGAVVGLQVVLMLSKSPPVQDPHPAVLAPPFQVAAW